MRDRAEEAKKATKQPVNEVELLPVIMQEDIREVAALAKEIWHEHYDSILGSEQVDYMTEKFQSSEAMKEQIEQGYRYYKLVNQDGQAGYYAFRTNPDGLFLSKIYVAAKYRGRGYSRRVMEFLENLCREQKLHRIWLTVNRNNSSSIAAYESLGFTKIRTQIADIGSGFVMDDYIMEKSITK
jgi:ribosomal protein S18 acetylase RimI-like enzyme